MFTEYGKVAETAAHDDFKDYVKSCDSNCDWQSRLIENCIYFHEVGRNYDWIAAYLKSGYELEKTHWGQELMNKEKATED